jgi:hypothetical protein
MPRRTSTGKCALCGGVFNKSVMTRHLAKCQSEHAAKAPPKGTPRKSMRLVVEGRRLPEYWLHLEMPADSTLLDLDRFLRGIWLECCGHLSAFTIDGVQYELNTGQVDEMWAMFGGRSAPQSMSAKLDRVLRPGTTFVHEYDFGTTTELKGKLVSEQLASFSKKEIVKTLARNLPPVIPCSVCGAPSTQLCTECLYRGTGCLCDDHTQDHKCGDEMFLPVVNSPRVGECGYTGPYDPSAYFNP